MAFTTPRWISTPNQVFRATSQLCGASHPEHLENGFRDELAEELLAQRSEVHIGRDLQVAGGVVRAAVANDALPATGKVGSACRKSTVRISEAGVGVLTDQRSSTRSLGPATAVKEARACLLYATASSYVRPMDVVTLGTGVVEAQMTPRLARGTQLQK